MKSKRPSPILEFVQLLTLSDDIEEILLLILERFMELTSSPKAAIDLVGADGSVDLQINRGLPHRNLRWLSSEGITGWVFEHKELLNVLNVRKDPRYRRARLGSKSELAAPLSFQGTFVGVINLESSKVGAFKLEHERLLRAVIPYLASWLATKRIETVQLARQSEQLKSLVSVGQAIANVTQHPEEILRQIVVSANKLLGADVSILYRFDGRTHKFLPNPTVSGNLLQAALIVKDAPRQSGGMAVRVREQGMVVVEDLETQQALESSFTRAEQIRSFVGIALKAGGDFIGVLYVNFRAKHEFPEHERFMIQAFAEQAAITVRKARLLEQFTMLNEIGQRINRAVESENLFQTVYQEVSRLLNTEVFLLAQYQEISQKVDLWLMDRDEYKWLEKQSLGGLTGWVIKERKPLLIHDRELENLPVAPQPIVTKIPDQPRSHLFAPLMVGERILGVISVQSYEPNMYSEEDLQLLSTLAAHVAVAMDNLALYGTFERLHSVGRSLTQTIELKDVLSNIAKSAQRDLHADIVYIYQYNATTDAFEQPSLREGELLDLKFPQRQIVKINDIAYTLVKLGQSHYARDAVDDEVMSGPREARRPNRFVLREKIASSSGVLLRAQQEIVGVMFVNYRIHQQFDERQKKQIELLANYAATAITQARLVRKLQLNLDRRLAELHAFAEIDKAITSASLPTVFEKILDAAIEITGNENGRGNIVLVDESGEYLDVPIAMRGGKWKAGTLEKFKIGGKGIVGNVAEKKKPARIANLEAKGWWTDWYVAVYTDTRSELAVPMLAEKGNLAGVINLESSRVGAFSEDDERLLMALAGQGVIAYQSARRFEAEQRARHEQELLNEIDRAISSTLNLEEVLQLILDESQSLIHAPIFHVMLYDERQGDLNTAAVRGTDEEPWHARQPLNLGIIGQVATTQQSVRAADVTLPPWNGIYFQMTPSTRSELAIPMLQGKRLIGVLNVESPVVGTFSENDQRLLEVLGSRAVITIQNSQRYEDEQRARRELQVLSDIDKAISSTLQLTEVLQLIIDKAMDLVNAPTGNIMLYDKEQSDLWMAAESGTLPQYKNARQSLDRGVVGKVARERHALRIADVTSPPWNEIYLQFIGNAHSELAVPMFQGSELVGVLNVESPDPSAFSEAHERLLNALGAQAVIAIQNSERYEGEQRARRELEVLSDIDKAISSTLQLSEVLQLILGKAMELVDAPTGNIKLYDSKHNDFYTVAEQGVAPESHFVRQGIHQGVIGLAARERRAIRVNDTQDEEWRGTFLPEITNTQSELAVPMVRGDELVGIINVESSIPHAFSPEHEKLLTALAEDAVIAVKNAELYLKQQKNKALVDALRQVDSAMAKNQKLEQVMTLLLEEGLRLTGAERGDIFLHYPSRGELEQWVTKDHVHIAPPPAQTLQDKVVLKELESITGHVAKTRQPYLSHGDVQQDASVHYAGYDDIHSEIAVPMNIDAVLVGVLNLESRDFNAFGEDDLDLLVTFAGQAAVAIQDARNRERFQVLNDFARQIINTPFNIDELLGLALTVAKEHTKAHSLSARWLDTEKDELVTRRQAGELHEEWSSLSLTEPSANAWVAIHKQMLYLPDVDLRPEGIPFRRGHQATKSELIVPIVVGNNYFGNLDLEHSEINSFDENEIKLAEGIAAQIGAAIVRIQQHDELELAKQRKQEAELMEAIGVSAMEIAHRIGNNLGPIATYVEEIRDALGTVTPEVNDRLANIVHDTKLTLDLEKRLKAELAKEKELSTERHQIPVRTVLEEASRSYLVPDNAQFDVVCPDGIPPIEADNRIHDAFTNLFTNAVQALQPRGGHIELGARLINSGVELWIKDDGPGIPKANQKRVFELFYSTKPEGIGFGLWSVRRYILANGGTIDLESDEGKGAKFKIRFPAVRG